MNTLPRSKILLVLGACLLLFLGNAAIMLHMQRIDPTELHALPWYQRYLQAKDLMSRPFTIFMYSVLVVYGLVWVFFPRKKHVSDASKMGVLAVVTAVILAYILVFTFKL